MMINQKHIAQFSGNFLKWEHIQCGEDRMCGLKQIFPDNFAIRSQVDKSDSKEILSFLWNQRFL